MHNKVLIVSPNPPFGGLLQRSLEETGRFRISFAGSCVQAAQMMAADSSNLALFDIDARDSSLDTAFPQFVKDYPDVPMVIFPPDNNLAHPLIAELEDATFLKKPFYLPELLAALDGFIGQQKTPLPQKIHLANDEEEENNLVDAQALELCLKQTLQETPAQAALLLFEDQLLAFSGRFSQESAAEAADILVRCGSVEAGSDLIRYARLKTTGEEILLYASLGPGQSLLVLGFSPHVGPRLARVTAHHALQALANLPFESDDGQFAAEVESKPLPAHVDELVRDEVETEPQEQMEDSGLIELLTNAPAPDPESADDLFNEWVPDEAFSTTEEGFRFPWEEGQVGAEITSPEGNADLNDTQPINEHKSPPVGDTVRPNAGQVFTCILLPRHPELILEDELCKELEEWIPQFCETFGWQLESLVIQPACLQWSIRVGPGVSQSYMVRILREQSTQHLAEKFPQIARDSGDGDFWAPGYLLVSGRQPPDEQYIEGFIRQTRRRQGFEVE